MGKTSDIFKKIRDNKGIFHAKMGTIKDRNGMDIPEQKKLRRGGKNTQKNYPKKKGLNDLDSHNGVVIHLDPDILECEVKWALGSITTNNVSRGDEIWAELFQIPKDDAVKGSTQYLNKFGKLSSGHRTG